MRSPHHARTLQSSVVQARFLRAFIKPYSTSTRRGYSPVVSNENDEVKVKVKVGLNGFVPLSIRHPLKPSPNGPIILFLPHGFPNISRPEPTTALAFSSNATVVRLGYRLSVQHPYPTPIHDVLAGYEWVQKHLARSAQMSNGLYETVEYAKLGICGELIGGSLASMLALTECHVGKPGISGAAVGNPIVDWTSLFPAIEEIGLHSKKASKESLPAQLSDIHDTSFAESVGQNPTQTQSNDSILMETLIALRSTLFAKPEAYFDPFISPLLFFRTPGYDLPPDPSAFTGLRLNALDDDPEAKDMSLPPIKKRRSHRKYPAPILNLKLPKMRVEVGEGNVLNAQGLELVELARRSVGLWEEGGRDSVWEEDGTTKLGTGAGAQRIGIVKREGLGLWGEREMTEIGQWFGEVLRRP